MISRRAVFVVVLALALVAGLAAAVCRACCPAGDERSAVLSVPACCGNCEPSLESSKDRALATVKKTTNDQVVAALAKPTSLASLYPTIPPIPLLAVPLSLPAPSPPAPLRL